MFDRAIIKSSKGQALVEMAILLPFLVLLVFGCIEFGRYLYLKNTATNGARQGARVAAVTKKPWDNDAKKPIYSAATSLLRGKGATAVIDKTDPAIGDPVTVTVTLPFTPNVTGILPMIPTSISASATMRYE